MRSVRCGIWARLGEKTPVALRSAVGALTCSPFGVRVVLRACTCRCPNGLSVTPPSPSSSTSRQKSVSYWVSGIAMRSPTWLVDGHAAGELQLLGVDVETIDVVEDAFGIVDDATRGRAVPVLRRQRRHAPPQASDQLVQLGKFGVCWTIDLLGLKGVRITVRHSMLATSWSPRVRQITSKTEGEAQMPDKVLKERRRRPAGIASTGQPGDSADGVGCLVGTACGRRGICCADRRQSPGGRFGRQARRRGHGVRRRGRSRQADHRRGRRAGIGRHRVRVRRSRRRG